MRYRKKPVVVDAFRWTGGPDQIEDPTWIVEAIRDGEVWYKEGKPFMWTPEGIVAANPGDYIIRGAAGEIYPCKPDIFEQTYQEVKQ